MDKVSEQTRSKIMSRVRSTGNKSTEIRFRMKMARAGLRGWEVRPKMPYSPDFIFDKPKLAIFIDGCFWHGCPKCDKMPSSNVDYWEAKIQRNIKRDKEATQTLKRNHWEVLRFWEHELKENIDKCLNVLVNHINNPGGGERG